MRVLLAGKHTPLGPMPMGGVQSWITTFKLECEKRGHDVTIWEPGMSVKGFFDLGVIKHLKYTRPVLNLCRKSIVVSHGIIPDEKPEAGCDVTAFVSEGVRDHWKGDGPIVPQPIDLDFWKPSDGHRGGLTRYGYRVDPIHGQRVAARLGMPYQHVSSASHEQARDLLQKSACVLATGRAALEAMACGAPTVIYDNRPYQGPLLSCGDMELNMRNSYSGRGGHNPTEDDVLHACRQEMELGSPRKWVEQNHDASKIVGEMLAWV